MTTPDTDTEPTVGEFYGPVIAGFADDIQELALRLFAGDFDTKSELTAAVEAAAGVRASQEDDS